MKNKTFRKRLQKKEVVEKVEKKQQEQYIHQKSIVEVRE